MTPLFEGLLELTTLTHSLVWEVFLVFLRVGAAMALLPAFGEQSIPKRVRVALSLCFTAIVWPAISGSFSPMEAGFATPVATEVIVGLALGIGLRLFVFALQIAGTLAAQSTSLSQLFGGQGGEPQPSMSTLFVVSGLALAVIAGLHVRIAELFILSYDMLPPGIFPDGSVFARWGVGQISNAFSLAFSLASPFIAASMIYNIALGVINRAMPQLMVVFVGAPALTLGGLVLLAVATPVMLAFWAQTLNAYINAPFSVSP
ncbi:flagellar biosynthetic protein FliR [Pseudorhodobacter antarcticus]|jgi:flagellar biosynthetic protein FliR|uniref:Flagellar biosynthetic protein FliR n=1 Tax=Pseudorhodobacter antarcticus TaxID=1077947 RepID=A0A1H8L1H2_9RHOB|nr:flagellar biosynthetic protein FliR [Pseudorhodobacter antarcticus]SEN99012.1 flagellar biosynthetic protein FliR [Pseudorhodobacter antarcticus]